MGGSEALTSACPSGRGFSTWLAPTSRFKPRLWPDLTGTAAVPAADPATIAAMADDFERRFRQQHAEAFRPSGTPIAWIALAVAYLRFSDENSNPRSLDQQLLNVLNRARRDGVFVPWHYVLADAAVSGTGNWRRRPASASSVPAMATTVPIPSPRSCSPCSAR